jgi:hypothetical protein
MPDRDSLPPALKALARRNALTLSHDSFRADVERLLTAVQQAADEPSAPVDSIFPSDPSENRGGSKLSESLGLTNKLDAGPASSAAVPTGRLKWASVLIRKNPFTRVIKVHLSQEDHVIEYRSRYLDSISIDGKVVKRIFSRGEGCTLQLSDGDQNVDLDCDFDYSESEMTVKHLTLQVGDRILYED